MRRVAVTCAVLVCLTASATPVRAQTAAEFEEALDGLSWRSIGPAEMGGRTVDIAAIPGDPLTVYFATATGGVWKTEDGAITWRSIFETGGTLSAGTIALAPSDPNVLYLGTGEGSPRNSTSIGDGVYRSTDAGETWVPVGLTDTERVSRRVPLSRRRRVMGACPLRRREHRRRGPRARPHQPTDPLRRDVGVSPPTVDVSKRRAG